MSQLTYNQTKNYVRDTSEAIHAGLDDISTSEKETTPSLNGALLAANVVA